MSGWKYVQLCSRYLAPEELCIGDSGDWILAAGDDAHRHLDPYDGFALVDVADGGARRGVAGWIDGEQCRAHFLDLECAGGCAGGSEGGSKPPLHGGVGNRLQAMLVDL